MDAAPSAPSPTRALLFSDDGKSLTPESQASTQHLDEDDADDDDESLQQDADAGSQAGSIIQEEDDEDENEEEEEEGSVTMQVEIPDDLDNLSASEHDEALESDAASDADAQEGDIEADGDAGGLVQVAVLDADSERAGLSDSRKRKRSNEVSPGPMNMKRLGGITRYEDVLSDEDNENEPDETGAVRIKDILLGKTATEDADAEADGDLDDAQAEVEPDEEAEAEEQDEEAEQEEAEPEAEPDEAEGDADTEAADRIRHRQHAMDALRIIEQDFAHLRQKLYTERRAQVEAELALAESSQHPILKEKADQNEARHATRLRRATLLASSRRTEIETEYQAKKFMAHAQYAQDRQKLRACLLSKTSAEWFQIHREKRIMDMAVSEYGYVVPERKATQLKHRREHDAEVAILASINKYIGFPCAPEVSKAAAKDVEADFAEMGIKKPQQHISMSQHLGGGAGNSNNNQGHHHHHHHAPKQGHHHHHHHHHAHPPAHPSRNASPQVHTNTYDFKEKQKDSFPFAMRPPVQQSASTAPTAPEPAKAPRTSSINSLLSSDKDPRLPALGNGPPRQEQHVKHYSNFWQQPQQQPQQHAHSQHLPPPPPAPVQEHNKPPGGLPAAFGFGKPFEPALGHPSTLSQASQHRPQGMQVQQQQAHNHGQHQHGKVGHPPMYAQQGYHAYQPQLQTFPPQQQQQQAYGLPQQQPAYKRLPSPER